MSWLLLIYLAGLVLPILEHNLGNLKYIPILGVSAVILAIRKRGFTLVDDSILLFLFAVLLVSGTVSTLVNFSGDTLLYLIFTPINLVVYGYFRTEGVRRDHLFWFIGLCLLCALPVTGSGFGGSLTGLYNNPNALAPVMTFVLYLFYCQRVRSRLLNAAFTALIVYIVLATRSRAGAGGMFAFLLIYWSQRLFGVHLRSAMLALLGMCIAGYLFIMETRAIDYIEAANTATQSDKGANFSHRDILYDVFKEKALRTPLGVGFGQSGDYASTVLNGSNFSPHNMYLKVAVETGWFYSIAFVLLYVYLVSTSKSLLANAFVTAYYIRCLLESATPFTMSLPSAMLLLPFFLNEHTIRAAGRAVLPGRSPQLAAAT